MSEGQSSLCEHEFVWVGGCGGVCMGGCGGVCVLVNVRLNASLFFQNTSASLIHLSHLVNFALLHSVLHEPRLTMTG